MGGEGFDFEEARRRFPDHWDNSGWAATNSTWQATNYPELRVRVVGRKHDSPFDDLSTMIYWSGSLESLRGLFTYEPTDRWNLGRHGLVYQPEGIDRQGRWNGTEPTLEVLFGRTMFGGPDTWHINFGENIPFFEPIDDWDP